MSIDGMHEFYCSEKNASVKDFEEVINNITVGADYLNITVRINVGNTGIEEACKLTHYLLADRDLENKIKVYIAHKRDYASRESEESEKQQFHQFLMHQQKYLEWMRKNSSFIRCFSFQKPVRRITSCLNICESGACIGPNGELYKCEHYFGDKDHVIGNVNVGNYYNSNQMKYLLYQHPEKCRNCDIFPVCMGGCCDDAINGRSKVCCDEYRKTILALKLISVDPTQNFA